MSLPRQHPVSSTCTYHPILYLYLPSGRIRIHSHRRYTVREQVVSPYQFGRSLEAAIEATDPDLLLLLGPGSSLSGAVGQTLSRMRWRGIVDKESFKAVQASATPALVATASLAVA